MMVLGDSELLGASLLPPTISGASGGVFVDDKGGFRLPTEGLVLENLERDLIEQALERVAGKLEPAAKMLGITYKTLQYRIKKYGLQKEKETFEDEIVPDEGRIA